MRATKFKIKPVRVFRVLRGSIIISGIKKRFQASHQPGTVFYAKGISF